MATSCVTPPPPSANSEWIFWILGPGPTLQSPVLLFEHDACTQGEGGYAQAITFQSAHNQAEIMSGTIRIMTPKAENYERSEFSEK